MTCVILTLQAIILILVLVVLQAVFAIPWVVIIGAFIGLACISTVIALLDVER